MGAKEKLGIVANAKINRTVPVTDENITALSNRVSVLEGFNISQMKDDLIQLMLDMQNLKNHYHTYEDDNGVSTTSKDTSTEVSS
jgi:hypothetical protein